MTLSRKHLARFIDGLMLLSRKNWHKEYLGKVRSVMITPDGRIRIQFVWRLVRYKGEDKWSRLKKPGFYEAPLGEYSQDPTVNHGEVLLGSNTFDESMRFSPENLSVVPRFRKIRKLEVVEE